MLFIIIFFIAPELCFSQKKVGTPKQELEILVDSIHETRSSDRASAIKFCLKAEILAKEIDDFETLDEIYYTLGSIYVWIDHKKSIEYSRIGISLSQTLENRNGSAKYYVLLGKIAASTEDPDTAIRLYSSADSIYTTDKDTYNLAWVKGALGHAYMEKSEYIKAIDLLSLSIKLNESIGLKEKTIVALVNLGNCRLELNQPDLAVTQLEEAYSLAEKLGDNYGKAIAGLVFSKFHQTFGRYSLAINFAQEAVEIAKQSENYYLLKKAYNELQELFKEAGDYKQSLTFLEFYHAAADTLENRKNDVLIADMQNAIAIKKQSFENELLKKEKSRLVYKQRAQSSQNKLLAILLISSCLILAILAILVILRNKSSKLKRKLDEETIKMKNREITNLSIYIKQRSLFINLIRNDLKKIRETDNDSTKNSLLTEVFVKVGQYARIDNDSGLIKEHIEESSQDFIARLDKVYPTLTKKEKRLAQLLRMKLSSKEIALLLDIAPHSVDISRYRLRKKLNLKKSEDLASCFANI